MTFVNPLNEQIRIQNIAQPCILVIFGATGDLTARKLLPALYNLAREGQLPPHFACVGFARRPKDHDIFRKEMLEAVNSFSRVKPVDQKLWNDFCQSLFYHQSEFHQDEGYDALKKFLSQLDEKFGTKGNRVYYLSTPPSYFPEICEKLQKHGLIYEHGKSEGPWSRVIIEKPFGHDLQSAQELQNVIQKYLHEGQIYRIDHWLGKETVQNILTFRFSNSIFESIWSNRHIDHVQITVAENIGIGTRGHFWEEAGMLRDIVQNHVMQLLSLVAMEPPINLEPSSIHEEKVKVLKGIRPIPLDSFDDYVVRGQYAPGFVDGKPATGYREENDVSPTSNVETYVALKLYIDNWRWAGVPFFLRAGKRMAKRVTEVAIIFKEAPGILFQSSGRKSEPNALIIRIQPDEGISLRINCKVPGMTETIQPVKMDFRYETYFGLTPPEAYERLICDCMAGDSTLFARIDEVETSWKLLTPVLQHWTENVPDFPNYAAGTWGPADADKLLGDHRKWRLL